MIHTIEFYPHRIENNVPWFKVDFKKIKNEQFYMKFNSKIKNEEYIGPILNFKFNMHFSK